MICNLAFSGTFVKSSHIYDAAFFRDAENIADRVPGKMPAVGDVVPGELSLPQLKDELDVDLSGHCSWLLSVNLE